MSAASLEQLLAAAVRLAVAVAVVALIARFAVRALSALEPLHTVWN